MLLSDVRKVTLEFRHLSLPGKVGPAMAHWTQPHAVSTGSSSSAMRLRAHWETALAGARAPRRKVMELRLDSDRLASSRSNSPLPAIAENWPSRHLRFSTCKAGCAWGLGLKPLSEKGMRPRTGVGPHRVTSPGSVACPDHGASTTGLAQKRDTRNISDAAVCGTEGSTRRNRTAETEPVSAKGAQTAILRAAASQTQGNKES